MGGYDALDTPGNRPGWKTSEGWLALAAVVLASLLASGVLPATWERVAAALAAALASAGYSVGRGRAKAGR